MWVSRGSDWDAIKSWLSGEFVQIRESIFVHHQKQPLPNKMTMHVGNDSGRIVTGKLARPCTLHKSPRFILGDLSSLLITAYRVR